MRSTGLLSLLLAAAGLILPGRSIAQEVSVAARFSSPAAYAAAVGKFQGFVAQHLAESASLPPAEGMFNLVRLIDAPPVDHGELSRAAARAILVMTTAPKGEELAAHPEKRPQMVEWLGEANVARIEAATTRMRTAAGSDPRLARLFPAIQRLFDRKPHDESHLDSLLSHLDQVFDGSDDHANP